MFIIYKRILQERLVEAVLGFVKSCDYLRALGIQRSTLLLRWEFKQKSKKTKNTLFQQAIKKKRKEKKENTLSAKKAIKKMITVRKKRRKIRFQPRKRFPARFLD